MELTKEEAKKQIETLNQKAVLAHANWLRLQGALVAWQQVLALLETPASENGKEPVKKLEEVA